MQGKQVLITGSTAGIGKAAATALAKLGAAVTIHGRSAARCEQVAAEIRAATGNAQVDTLPFDLSSMKAVRQAAETYQARHAKLDVLGLCAGVFLAKREVSEDGFEKSLAMGFAGHFLLTQLLLPQLKTAGDARVVTVAAPLDRVKVDFDNLQLEKNYSFMKAVPQSKALLVMAMLDLAKTQAGQGITSNYMHPGLIKTDLLKETPWIFRAMLKLIGAPPEKGADTLVYLASAAEVKGVTGKYFHARKDKPFKGMVADAANQKKATEIGMKLTGLRALSLAH
jgi:NAD(P)-dependent dehydrogenase (short-subunit alcohol dehydrogenase family)